MADTALDTLRDKYKKEMGLDSIGSFSDGRAWVVRDGQEWHIDANGNKIE